MATKPDRWYFTREQLRNSASAKCGIDPEKELSYRQQAANLIQDMGQRLQVYQLCINTAIVYMHRFYMFHSFTKFPRNNIAAAALFLAAKVEEQPHKLEHVIRVAHACLHRGEPPLDPRSKAYAQEAQELVINESIILQTLGFEVGVVHPHTHVVMCTQMIRASKDLSQSSYFLATNSLHLTTFCLKYKPTVVACVCIHIACKWTQWTIPKSNDGKGWWEYVDPTVTEELLDELTREFLHIIERCPTRLKKRIMGYQKAGAVKDAKRPKTDGQPNSDTSHQHASDSKTDGKPSTSSLAAGFDFSFDSKPASGFGTYSDSEDSKSEEPSSQKSDKSSRDKSSATASSAPTQEQPRKPETVVKVSFEEYKRKERERKEKEMLAKRHQQPAAPPEKTEVSGLSKGRSVSKDTLQHGHKSLPGSVDKNALGVKERVPPGHDSVLSGQERVHPSHERPHTGHDRIPHSHDKHGLSRDKLSGYSRPVPSHDKIHTAHTRGPSGPDRLPSSQERSASGLDKPPSSQGRDPAYSRPPGYDKTSSGLGSKSQEKTPLVSVDFAKHPGVKHKNLKRPELHPASSGGSKDGQVPTERTLLREVSRKEHGQRSYAEALKVKNKGDKEHTKQTEPSYHSGTVTQQTHSHRAPEPPVPPSLHVPPIPESLQAVQREPLAEPGATQETLAMFNQITAEIEKDLEKESLSNSPVSLTYPISTNIKVKRRKPELIKKEKSQMLSPLSSPVKSSDTSHADLEPGELVEEKPAEVESTPDVVQEHHREGHESRREKRKEGHKSKRDDKKHKSHKHRQRSPTLPHKIRHENDIGEGSGDMVPAKKQRLEQTGSPHTVLTTSQGIKLKIKGLTNSFNNGSDHSGGKDTEKVLNASSDSPSSLSLKLNLSKLGSPRESSKEKEGSNHHYHRSHHKHKSRHHRSKDGHHHKLTQSPGFSSASDASPAISPSKRRPVETAEGTMSGYQSVSQSLDPVTIDSVKSSRHASPSIKHGKRKRESNPPLPIEVLPPPPPPPAEYSPLTTVTGLPPMQYSTIDASALYNFQPPLPSEKPVDRRPPPPPPIPPPQKRPPLPP